MKTLVCTLFAAVVATVFGDGVVTNSIVNGITDWTLPESYSNNRVPLENDVVEIPRGCTGTVNTVESLAVVSRLWQVRPMDESSTIVFDFASGTVTNESAIAYSNSSSENSVRGRIVKRGNGTVVMMAHNRFGASPVDGKDFREERSYQTRFIDVEGGALMMPQGITRHQFEYGHIALSEGTTFGLPTYDAAHPGTCPACYCNIAELSGYGNVSNAASYVMQLRPSSGNFYGNFLGKGSLYVRGWINCYGTNSTFIGNFQPAGNATGRASTVGTIGVGKFGWPNVPSAIGTQDNQPVPSSGGGYVYLGTGDSTFKRYFISAEDSSGNPATGGLFLDGGQHGNLTFTGGILISSATERDRQILYLDGTNDVGECVLNCQISTNLYICKRGPGTWRLADFTSNYWGAFQWADSLAVEEGTLKFDSLAEAGTRCALGYGTRKRRAYFGFYDAAKDVPHSITLGGEPSARATLQYNGATMSTVLTRPVAVTGTGILKGSEKAGGILGWSNVWADDNANGTLVLEGLAGTTNVVANVADSNGVLSVVKTGPGAWRLTGDIDISGDLRAEGGTLEVDTIPANAAYGWYRVSIRELNTYKAGSGEKNLFQLQEFALYDADGKRHFINPHTYLPATRDGNVAKNWSDYLLLEPGSCCRGNVGDGHYSAPWNRSLDQIFNEGAPTADNADYSIIQEATRSGSSLLAINRDTPESFFKFVMRLENGTPPIVSYDMARYRGNYPVCWTIEASTDGLEWQEVAKVDDFVCATSVDGYTQGYWISDGVTFAAKAVRKYDATAATPCGFPFSRSNSTRPGFKGSKIRAISASRGATLRFVGAAFEAKGLVGDVGADSSGTIENATYAEEGTLYLAEDLPSGVNKASANVRLGDVATRGNVANWTVKVGERTKSYAVTVDENGEVGVLRKGIVLIVR